MTGRCSLCGSRLNNGKCVFCGLNNKMYGREYMRNPYHLPSAGADTGARKSESAHREKIPRMPGIPETTKIRGNSVQRLTISATPPRRNDYTRIKNPDSKAKKYKAVTLITILIIVICMFAPALIQIIRSMLDAGSSSEGKPWLTGIENIFSDGSDVSNTYEDHDPYEYVTREIPDTGSTYETTIGGGVYQVGIHMPEGVYQAELAYGTGSLQISDAENLIYESIWFGEDGEDEEVTEADGLWLYNGAQITISGSAALTFTTSNAQPLTQDTTANPLTESVILDEGIYTVGEGVLPEGIYDVVMKESEGYVSFSLELLYPNGSREFLWTARDSASSEGRIRNVILPTGTELTFDGDPAEFLPGEGYFEVNYAEYAWN